MNQDLNISSDQVDVPGFRALLEAVSSVCRRRDIRFFIVGALARDLLLEHVHGMAGIRATQDVDVAIAVSGWEQYEQVTEELIQKWGYRHRPEPHRLLSEAGVLLDLIPFGEIEHPPGRVGWPPDQDFVMTTLGFDEAYHSAVTLTIDGDLPLRVASLPGIGVLKLIAWSERPYDRKRDAADLCIIMKNYYDVVGDALYTDHLDLFDAEPFDRNRTSCRIFGRDIARLLHRSEPLRDRVLEVLDAQLDDTDQSTLAVAMGSGCMVSYMERLEGIRSLRTGIVERRDRGKA